MNTKLLIFGGLGALLLLGTRKQTRAAAVNSTAQQRALVAQNCTFAGLGKLMGGLLSGLKQQQQKPSPSSGGKSGGAPSSGSGSAPRGGPSTSGGAFHDCGTICMVDYLCGGDNASGSSLANQAQEIADNQNAPVPDSGATGDNAIGNDASGVGPDLSGGQCYAAGVTFCGGGQCNCFTPCCGCSAAGCL